MNKINVTDARKDMSAFFDGVIHEKPIILKKRRYEAVLIEKTLLKVFLSQERINVLEVGKSENEIILSATKLDIQGKGSTKVEAIDNLCTNLFAYANDVYNNFMFYFYGQNIKDKLGLIFHIILCEDNEHLKEIMDFEQKRTKKK